MQGRGADEGVNAWAAGVLNSLPTAINVFQIGAGQTTNHGVFGPFGNLCDSLKIALRGDGKARFDDIDAHFVQKPCDFELFIMGHGRAGALFTVTQCGVKNDNSVFVGLGHRVSLVLS